MYVIWFRIVDCNQEVKFTTASTWIPDEGFLFTIFFQFNVGNRIVVNA